MAIRKKPPGREGGDDPLAPNTSEGQKAYQSVLKHGFPSFPRPDNGAGNHYRVLPENLTILGSDDLGEQMSYWNAMHNYAVEQSVLVWNDLDAEKRKIEKLVNARLGNMTGDTVTERKAKAKSHADVISLQERVDHLHMVHNLIEGIKGNCERNCSTVSREITRRSSNSE
jgi:hypothetical protein